jgi:hypothetical protein
MAKHLAKHRRPGIRLPLAVVAGFMPLVSREISVTAQYGLGAVPGDVAQAFLPYNPTTRKFDTSGLSVGLIPVVVGILVHRVIGGYLGVNRALAGAGIPFVRI